jgi:hypothetical protein
MVEPRKTHNGYKTPFYLILLLSTAVGPLGCSENTAYEVIDLHFKNATQVETILQYAISDSPEIQFSEKTVLIPSNSKNINTVLRIIKEIDKPPTSYKLDFDKQNIKSRSTNTKKDAVFLLEGKETITQYNNHQMKILILKASANSSLVSVTSLSLKGARQNFQKNNWLVQHDKINDMAKDIFPSGFTLRTISQPNP